LKHLFASWLIFRKNCAFRIIKSLNFAMGACLHRYATDYTRVSRLLHRCHENDITI